MKFSAIILVAAVMVSLADAFLPAALPRRRAAMARLRMMGQVDVTIEKPLGITLEENEADAAKGVFCKLLANPGAAYDAGVRVGDVISSVGGKDAMEMTFDEVMGLLQEEESPVSLTLERAGEDEPAVSEAPLSVAEATAPDDEEDAGAAVVPAAPKKKKQRPMPSAERIVKVATNKNVWLKDPIYLSSAVFAVGLPLLLLIASSGSN